MLLVMQCVWIQGTDLASSWLVGALSVVPDGLEATRLGQDSYLRWSFFALLVQHISS